MNVPTETTELQKDHGPRFIDHNALNPHYITGLCEGEASFTYVRNGRTISLRFGIKLSESDKNLIFALQGYFRAGKVYFSRPKGGRGTWYYCVTSIGEISNLIDHFELYPLKGRKAQVFKYWHQLFELKKQGKRANLDELNRLASIITSLSPKRRKTVNSTAVEEPRG